MPPGIYPFGNKKEDLPEITMSDFRARVEKAGKEWKGEDRAYEWNKGKIADGSAQYRIVPDPPVAGAVQPERIEDPRTAGTLPVNQPNIPQGDLSRSPLMQPVIGLVEGAVPWAGPPSAVPESSGLKWGRAAGTGAGMALPFSAGSKAMSLTKLPGAIQSAATLGAYNASQYGLSPAQRAISGVEGAALGAGLHTIAAFKPIAPIFQNPATGTVADTAIMTGMNLAAGADPEDAFRDAVTMALGVRGAAVAEGAFARKGKTLQEYVKEMPEGGVKILSPQESALKANAEYLEMYRDYNKPVAPDATLSNIVSELKTTGDVERFAQRLGSEPIEGSVTPEVKKEIKARVAEEAKLYKEANGKKMPKDERKELARRYELEESLPKGLIEAIQNGDILNKGWGSMTDWRRGLQGAGQRKITENPADTYVLRVNEQLHLLPDQIIPEVYTKISDPVKDMPVAERKAFGEYMAAKSRIKALESKLNENSTPDQVMAVEAEIADLANFSAERASMVNPGSLAKAESGMREAFNYVWNLRAPVEKSLTGKDFGKLEDYYPAAREKKSKSLKNWYEDAQQPRRLEMSDEGKVNSRFFSPRAARRSGKTAIENMVTDPLEVAKDYARDFARSTVYQGAIKYNRAVADYARMNGLEKFADSLDRWSASAYTGQPVGMDAKIQGVLNESPTGRVIMTAIEDMGQAFRGSTFTLNTGWSLTTQGTSSALAAGMYPEHAAQAAILYAQPQFRRLADQTYTMQMKSRRFGRVQDVGRTGDVLEGARVGKRTKGEIAEDGLGALSRAVEAETGYYTAAVRYLHGKKMGLEGADLMNYMSDGIAKFQSMYDRFNRPGLMNNRLIAGWIPMQSFKIEMMNVGREMLGVNGIGAKEIRSNGELIARMGGLIGATLISDWLTGELGNKDNYNITTPIPFADATGLPAGLQKVIGEPARKAGAEGTIPMWLAKGVSGALPSDYGAGGLPASTMQAVGSGFMDLVTEKDGERRIEQGIGKIARPFVRGGAQIKATLETIGAARGAHAVDIEKDEIMRSLLFGGPYSTPSGKENIEKYEGTYKPKSVSADRRGGTQRSGSSRKGSQRQGSRR